MITVVIQDELGKEIAGGIDLPASSLSAHDDERFICARFIDPYGDTFFNYLQVPYFLDELRLLKANATNTQQKDCLEQIEELVAQYRDEVHVYVKLIGD